eukprot:symbB.v1.2.005686.t1/scaffold334.1/size226555/9
MEPVGGRLQDGEGVRSYSGGQWHTRLKLGLRKAPTLRDGSHQAPPPSSSRKERVFTPPWGAWSCIELPESCRKCAWFHVTLDCQNQWGAAGQLEY